MDYKEIVFMYYIKEYTQAANASIALMKGGHKASGSVTFFGNTGTAAGAGAKYIYTWVPNTSSTASETNPIYIYAHRDTGNAAWTNSQGQVGYVNAVSIDGYTDLADYTLKLTGNSAPTGSSTIYFETWGLK